MNCVIWSQYRFETSPKGVRMKTWTLRRQEKIMYSYEERIKAIELYIKYDQW
jgi:hypothetical protein